MTSTALRVEHRLPVQPSSQRAPVIAIARQSRQNRLLRALPEDVWNRLAAHLQLVELPLGTCLVDETCGLVKYVYFPTNSMVSMLCVMEDGTSAQTAMVGVEGMVGISLFMGCETSNSRAIVHGAGYAFRLPARVLAPEFERDHNVTRLLLRYTQSLIIQIAQTAVCNRHHSIEQQFCRCLLSSLDRLPGNELAMTHELISNMIGVRREGVTEAAGKLQRLGIISYSRGRIQVLNRQAMEERACECYSVVKRESDSLLRSTRMN